MFVCFTFCLFEGPYGIKVGLKRGAFSVLISSSRNFWNVSSSVYKYFEFWVKVAPGYGETALTGESERESV